MSYDSARAAIYARIAAKWTGFPLVAANQPWPSGTSQPARAPWGRYSIRYAGARTTDVTGKHRRVAGVIWLQIFIPLGTGEKPAQAAADTIETIFGERHINTGDSVVRTERAELRYVGRDGDFDQHHVTVSFIEDSAPPRLSS